MKTTTLTIGTCGEHFVASFLSGLGLIVALPRGGAPGSDLFVTGMAGGSALRIQVKTGTQAIKKDTELKTMIYLWSASVKIKSDPHAWFAFLWLNSWPEKESHPHLFFVPSAFVADRMKSEVSKSWTYFWMTFEEAEQFRGRKGLDPVLAILESQQPLES